ncbi:MAG: hypothetical protein HDS69_09625 [Bacteroidales bacterium]|nr:hypothetical protein [Bacteroidales bacterium]
MKKLKRISTKHFIAMIAIVIAFAGISSCKSDKTSDKEDEKLSAIKVAEEFVEAANTGSNYKIKELYPESKLGTVDTENLTTEGATIKDEGDYYIVSLPNNKSLYIKKSGEKYIIFDSERILTYPKTGDVYKDINYIGANSILNTTGLRAEKKISTDIEWLNQIHALVNGDPFVSYLKNKYPDALNGNNKTIKVNKRLSSKYYYVDVVFESGGQDMVEVIATAYDKNGKRLTQESRHVSPSGKGDRTSVLLMFDSYATGKIDRIDVKYSVGLDNEAGLIGLFAPLQETDFSEYKNS